MFMALRGERGVGFDRPITFIRPLKQAGAAMHFSLDPFTKTSLLLAFSLLLLSGCASTMTNTEVRQSSHEAIKGTGMPDFPDRSR